MQSAAFVVGPMDGPCQAIIQLCQDLGFATTSHYVGPDQVEAQSRRTPVCFFLVSSATRKSAISEFVTDIRHHRDRALRFSPLLFLCEDPSSRTISFCVQAGFDDIVAPPFTAPRLAERVKAQLNTPMTYFETETYFGPDRRRKREFSPLFPEQRGASTPVRQFEVRRDLRHGIQVTTSRNTTLQAGKPTAPVGHQVEDHLLID